MADPLSAAQTELGLPLNTMLLNRYRITKMLGAGGMGCVYMAEDQKLGIPVAIKVLRDVLRQDPGSVKRLISEAKASIMLSHPNIVRMHNFEDGETTKFLVMEFVEGETLADLIAKKGRLEEPEVRHIAAEVCKGLEHAHLKKVIHRDMKPGNILLGKDGSVKVADFGIARLCRDSVSRLTSQHDSGTLLYMSPEQLDGESGESSDLYSLGVVLYEMLAGDPPFMSGEITAQIRHKAPKEIPGVSPEMNRVVLKCLEKKPENRFANLAQLRATLEGRTEKEEIPEPVPPPQPPRPQAPQPPPVQPPPVKPPPVQPPPVRPEPPKKSTLKRVIVGAGILFGVLVVLAVIGNLINRTDLSGDWTYTVTMPDGRGINGRFRISQTDTHVQFTAEAAYSAMWTDGRFHNFVEQSTWSGTLSDDVLVAQTTGAAVMVDGMPIPPTALPWHVSLTVSDGARHMQGTVANALGGVGGLTATR
jgi:serine/threonine protein kinase